MLNSYLTNTQNLLQNPSGPASLYGTSELTTWINIARGQIAGESECIRVIGTIPTVVGQRTYNFSSVNTGTVATTGIQGIINIRNMLYMLGSNTYGDTGLKWIKWKRWQWFLFYRMNNPVPNRGAPTEWTQFSPGSAGQGSITGVGTGTMGTGSFYVDPIPDIVYNLSCDCVGYPQALAADTDVEALTYLWTDAVPYFAAYLALMSAQTGQRIQEAQQMLQLYEQFTQRARNYANPPVNRYQQEQAQDPFMQNRLGTGARAGAPGA